MDGRSILVNSVDMRSMLLGATAAVKRALAG